MAIINPVPGFNFRVLMFNAPGASASIAGAAGTIASAAVDAAKGLVLSFSEVTGLNAELEIESYQEGGRNTAPRKFVKWGRYPNLTLRRGVTFVPDLWDWYYQVLYGTDAPIRKNGVVILTDRGGPAATGLGIPVVDATPVAAWFFRNALPERLQGPSLNAKSNEIAIESLELSHEGLVRLGPGMIPGLGSSLAALGV